MELCMIMGGGRPPIFQGMNQKKNLVLWLGKYNHSVI
jgi:hypothetical protein